MTLPLLILQIVTLLAIIFVLFRKQPAPPQDPRLTQLPDQIGRLENQVRAAFNEMRGELKADAQLDRISNDAAAASLRNEISTNITTLGQILKNDLNSFREDNASSAQALRVEVVNNISNLGNTLTLELAKSSEEDKASAERLRNDVEQKMRAISQGFGELKNETGLKHSALQESLNSRLIELMGNNANHQDKLRTTVEASLTKLNTDNSSELEKMRQTVDEKLQSTLHTRLTESFGQVTDQLNKVHTGLGEMSKLSEGVDDLSRIFTNVKSRGGFAEVQLGMLLEQMLAPAQFVRNAKVKPGTLEIVEFAVRFPGISGETLLPIDAKFPREDWERLEAAYATNNQLDLEAAGKAFEAAIRTEGRRICDKYINPPLTTPHAIMFLPTEGLYAEVMRRDALQAEIQSKCQVTIAGPSTLSAILTSFQMGFHMLAMQEKGDEVWKVLEATKTEFKNFESLMNGMEKQVGTVQNTIHKLGVRTRAINRTLREVGELENNTANTNLIGFEDLSGVTVQLAASSEDEIL